MNCEHVNNERVDNRSRARWCPDCGAIFRPNKYEWEPPRADPPIETRKCSKPGCTYMRGHGGPHSAETAPHPAPTETLVRRGTVTIGPEPDGSVRQVAIVGVAQGASLRYASPRPEPQHSDDGGGDGDDDDGGA